MVLMLLVMVCVCVMSVYVSVSMWVWVCRYMHPCTHMQTAEQDMGCP